MALDISTFEILVPSRFLTFTFPSPTRPRSSILRVAVLDSPILQVGRQPQIAAMFVPENREDDWIFCTESGHLQLLFSHSPDLSRLILIGIQPPTGNGGSISTLNVYPRVEFLGRLGLGETLGSLLIALTPKSCSDGTNVPIATYEDGSLCSVIREKCIGSMVGEMLIEDVEVETEESPPGGGASREFRRRLRFKRMPNLVQTQVRIVPDDIDFDINCLDISVMRFRVDSTVLVHPYLAPMVASLSLLIGDDRKTRPKVLCLGVGGGALISFLRVQLDFEVFGVEGDVEVLRVAKKYFGLQESDELVTLVVADAMDVIEKLASCETSNFDVVMIDLDSEDAGTGLIAPPFEFVNNKSIIVGLRSILSKCGIVIVNVAPANKSIYDVFVSEFRKSFVELYEIDIGNGENFVVIGTVGATATDSSSSWQMKKLIKSGISEDYINSVKKI